MYHSTRMLTVSYVSVYEQSHLVFFPEEPIGSEMENFEFEYTRTGVRYTAPVGLHDDCVMALALAVDCKAHNRPGTFYFA